MFKFLSFIKEQLLWFIVSIAMILTVFMLVKDAVLSGDDLWIGFYGDYKYIFLTPEHGRFIQSLQMKTLCCWVPKLLHIHPNAMSYVNSFVVGLNFTLLCFATAMFGYIGQKKTKMVPLIAVGVFLFCLNLLIGNDSIQELRVLTFHFSYILGLVMFFAFLLIFGEVLYTPPPRKSASKTVIFCSVFSFLAALNDTYAYIGIISIFFAFCVLIFMILRQSFKNHDFLGSFKSFYKKYYALISMSVCFVIGGIIAILTTLRMEGDRFVDSNFNSSLSNFCNLFLPQFWDACILRYLPFVLLLLLLFTILLLKSDKDKKDVFYPTFLTVGIFGFFFMLFFGGSKYYYEIDKFWIYHRDLQNNYLIILIAINITLWGFLKTNNRKVFNAIMVICICATFFLFPKIESIYPQELHKNIIARKTMYISEKMYLFYIYNQETAILPISALKQYISESFYLLSNFIKTEYDINISAYVYLLGVENHDDINAYNSVEEATKKIKFSSTWFRTVYVPKIYNLTDEDCLEYGFDDDDKALKNFCEKGGTFTVEELELLDFTKLLDKEFVLNKNK